MQNPIQDKSKLLFTVWLLIHFSCLKMRFRRLLVLYKRGLLDMSAIYWKMEAHRGNMREGLGSFRGLAYVPLCSVKRGNFKELVCAMFSLAVIVSLEDTEWLCFWSQTDFLFGLYTVQYIATIFVLFDISFCFLN